MPLYALNIGKVGLSFYFPSLHQVQLARERISPEIKVIPFLSINYFLGDPSTPLQSIKK